MLDLSSRTQKLWRALVALYLITALAASPAPARQSGAAAAPAAALTDAERGLAERIKAENIKEITTALSAPAMQGRGTG